jgi:hypothetical protein
MRKKIVAGNWKMNKTPKEAAEFCKLMKEKVVSDAIEVVFCVPFVDLYPVLEELKGTGIGVGAENMHFAESGAYTGEVSAQMLKEMGVGYVILGHSERRQYFGETDEMVNQKVKKALETGIVPILCCGETLEQREAGITIEWEERILNPCKRLEICCFCHADCCSVEILTPDDIIGVFYFYKSWIICIDWHKWIAVFIYEWNLVFFKIPVDGIFAVSKINIWNTIGLLSTEHTDESITIWHNRTVKNSCNTL